MTDLEAKFTAVETQLAGQHTEIMAALASIGAALGAPPTTPTATMDDLLEAIQMTNSILTTMLTTSNSHLLAIFNTLDTMNNNASLNSQRILNTLLQTSCPCDTTVPLLPPPLGTTPISAESLAHCQRVQYFIDLFAGWAIDVGRYVGEMGSISSFQIDNLLAIHVGDVGITTGQIADPMPTAVRDNIVGQITSAVSASGAESVNTGLFMAMTNPDNLDGMRQALYGEDNADAGRAALDDMLDSLVGMEDPYTSMIRTMFYSAWLNDIYGDVPIVDASAYDGTLCDPDPEETGCHTYPYVFSPSNYAYIIFGTELHPGTDEMWMVGDYQGYTFTILSQSAWAEIAVVGQDSTNPFLEFGILHNTGDSIVIPVATTLLRFTSRYNNTVESGTVEVCAPGPS